jgi:hypothetical protein
MDKYLELEFDTKEIEFLIKEGGLSFDEIILDSLKKIRSICLKTRVKNALIGTAAGPDETLNKILGGDTIEQALRFQKLGFDFINLDMAKYLAISYFNNKKCQRDLKAGLPKCHYDAYFELAEKLKDKLEFTMHLPTDEFVYEDPKDKLFSSCLHLANELSKTLPQLKLPLSFHSYRKKKSASLAHDLETSKEKTADLIIRVAKFLNHLERKGKLKITLALEMLNQELPTSHYICYCVSPYQVLETYHYAVKNDKEGLVEKYFSEGTFSVTFDIGHFLLDQKFQEFMAGQEKYHLNHSLYFGFEEFCKKISLFHISGILNKEYLSKYLDNRRVDEFCLQFGREYTHHCPFLISDVEKIGEVLKQVELFQNIMD